MSADTRIDGRGPRCYTRDQVREKLHLSRRTFYTFQAQGKLPFLEECQPRLGRTPRYRADLVDRYLAGQWPQPRRFGRSA